MNKEEKNLQDYLQKIKFKDKIVLNHEDVKASFAKIKERIDLPNEVVLPHVKKVNLVFKKIYLKKKNQISMNAGRSIGIAYR